jgi:hypothetical protein
MVPIVGHMAKVATVLKEQFSEKLQKFVEKE